METPSGPTHGIFREYNSGMGSNDDLVNAIEGFAMVAAVVLSVWVLRKFFFCLRNRCIALRCWFAHDWYGCSCRRRGCTATREHEWNGCKCQRQGCAATRDAGHDWNACSCARCGATRHEVENCCCNHCKGEVHQPERTTAACGYCHAGQYTTNDSTMASYTCGHCGGSGQVVQSMVCKTCGIYLMCEGAVS